MKNFKKVLALVLVVATLLSFATVASAATSASYTDADKVTRTAAVDVLSYIGVLNGYSDKTFRPQGEITRAEAAKIIAMFDNGSAKINGLYASANPFTDCVGHWAESSIAYCYKMGIIDGVGNLKFDPESNVTGVQFLKMALIVLGYDAKKEGLTGASWAVNTLSLAKKAGLLEELGFGYDYSANLVREDAAQIMLNALNSQVVDYGYEFKPTGFVGNDETNVKYVTTAGAVVTDRDLKGQWDLASTYISDAFYRPGYKWTAEVNGATKTIASYYYTPAKEYTEAVSLCDLLVDLGVAKSDMSTKINFEIYTNGKDKAEYVLASHTLGHEHVLYGGKGTKVEAYFMGYNDGIAQYRVVVIYTYLAQVTDVKSYKTNRDGHVGEYDTVTVKNWVWDDDAANEAVYTGKTVAANGFTKDQYVLIDYSYRRVTDAGVDTRADAGIQNIEAAPYAVATLTGFLNKTAMAKQEMTYVNYEEKFDAYQFELGFAASKTNANVTKTLVFFFDAYGNVIGVTTDVPASTLNYTVIDAIAAHDNWDRVATANLVGLDAKLTEKVNVVKFNGCRIAYNEGDGLNALTRENGACYDLLYTYTTNSDGDYTLLRATTTDLINITGNKTALKFTVNGDPNFYVGADLKDGVIADKNTQYLFHLVDGSYVAFTGYANVPTTKAVFAEAVVGTDGIADIVYATDVELPGSSALAMVFNATYHDHHYLADQYTVYDRYTAWVGTTKTTVYVECTGNDSAWTWGAPNLYTLSYTTVDGEIVAVAGGLEASGYANAGVTAVEYVGDTSAKVAGLPAFAEEDVTIYCYDTTYQDVREGTWEDLANATNTWTLTKNGAVAILYVDVTE